MASRASHGEHLRRPRQQPRLGREQHGVNNNGPLVDYRSDTNVENADYDATMYFRYNTVIGTERQASSTTTAFLVITENVFKDCRGPSST